LLPYTGVGSGIRRALSLYPAIQVKNDELRNEFIITIPRRTSETALKLSSQGQQKNSNVSNVAIDTDSNVSKNDSNVTVNAGSNVSREGSNVSKNESSVSNVAVDNVSDCIELLNENNIVDETRKILSSLMKASKGRKKILAELEVSYQTYNIRRFIDPLIQYNLINPLDDVRLKGPNLELEITKKGKLVLRMPNDKKNNG